MKKVIALVACLFMTSAAYAASCPDMQESANAAMQSRNGRVSESHNTMMPDPEGERDDLSECLKSIQSIGDAFTLGVSLPGIDQVVSGMCGQVDSYLQQKINDVHNQALNQINGLGGNNPLKVYGTGGDYIIHLTRKLK